MNIQRINLLKQKYNMYCSSNGKINIHNYLVIYREFISANATDVEIYKSFNGFDSDRDGFLNFLVIFKRCFKSFLISKFIGLRSC